MVTASSGHSSEKKGQSRYSIYLYRKREKRGRKTAGSQYQKKIKIKRGNIPYQDKTLISLPSSEKMRQSNHSNTSDFVAFLLFFFYFLDPSAAGTPFQILQLSIDAI